VHASIWHFEGDPDALARAYDALRAEIGPMALQLCLRAPGGIVLIDTCPSREAFAAFAAGDDFRALRARHGLPDPVALDDFPVHAAIVDGVDRA
jgi:hypothetical protein